MFEKMDPEKVIVCRCEGVTLAELRDGIERLRITDLEELKRMYRCGMGPCQGRTCEKVIKQVIQEYSDGNTEIGSYSYRPPLVPIKFEELAKVETDDVS